MGSLLDSWLSLQPQRRQLPVGGSSLLDRWQSEYGAGLGDSEDDDPNAGARRILERYHREAQAPGTEAPPTATALDMTRRIGAAMLSNVSGPFDMAEAGIRHFGGTPESFAAPLKDAAVAAVTAIPRAQLAAIEAATGGPLRGLPTTSAGQQAVREHWRSLEHPGQSPVGEAISDTAAEAAGAMLDPVAGGTGLIRGLRSVGPLSHLATVERRVAAVSPELAALADASTKIGPSEVPTGAIKPLPADLDFRTTKQRDGSLVISAHAGDTEVGWTKVRPDPAGGFHVDWVEKTAPEYKRVGQALYEEAGRQTGGGYLGAMAQTEPGSRMGARMREEAPELFERPAEQPAPVAPLRGVVTGQDTLRTADVMRPLAPGAEPTLPPGSPQAVGPAVVTPQFQSNLFAQIGDPAVRDYLVNRSDEIAQAIGPVQTWDDVEQMALRSGTTKERFLAKNPKYALMPPEERARLTMVIKGTDDDISSLQAKIAAGSATDEEKVHALRLIDQRGSLIKLAVGSGSEYGRALNTLRMEARASLGESSLARQTLYRRYSEVLDKNKPLMDTLARLDPSNPEELQTFLRHVDQPHLKDYLQEYWVGSVLSGVGTQERNIIGNVGAAVAENMLVRPVRAALDPLVAAAQGRERMHYMSEAPYAAVGMTHGIRKGLAKGLEILKRGYDPDMEGKLLPVRSAFARSQNRVVREMVGPVATGSLRLLTAADAVFKSMNHTAEIYAQAANIAAKEGAGADRIAELVASPTREMVDKADTFALKATFNDPVSNVGKQWIKLRDSIPGGMFLSPFVKIADRLMARGFEYTPYGFVKAGKAAKAGEGAAVSDLAARGAIGSAVMMAGASLAADGRLTASAPSDPAERDAFYRAGKKAWAVKMGDTWVPFGQMQPIASPLALIAAMHQGWQENGQLPPEERIAATASEIGKYITDQSYLDSLGKFFDAVSGGQGAGKAARDLGTQVAAGFMPLSGFARTVSQGIDPRILDARTVGDKLKSQIPVVSKQVPAKVDAWGEDATPSTGRLRGVLASGTPLDASREQQSPLDAELARIGMPLGFVDQRFHDPIKGTTAKLSPDDWRDLQRVSGRKSKEMLTALFADPSYQQADAEAQRQMVERMVGAARQYGRMDLLAKRYGWRTQ